MKNISVPRLLNLRSQGLGCNNRNGHRIYLIFLMTFANFITIQYQLLLQRVPAIHSFHINIWIFSLIFVAASMELFPTNFQGVENGRISTFSDTIVNAAETGSARKTKSWLAPSS